MPGHQYLQLGEGGAGDSERNHTSGSPLLQTVNGRAIVCINSVQWECIGTEGGRQGGKRGVEVFKAGSDGDTGGYRCFQLPTNSEQFPPLSDHTSHCEADGSPEQRGVEIAIV